MTHFFWLLEYTAPYGILWVSSNTREYCLTGNLEEALRFTSKRDADYYLGSLISQYSDSELILEISTLQPVEHGIN